MTIQKRIDLTAEIAENAELINSFLLSGALALSVLCVLCGKKYLLVLLYFRLHERSV
jgi:hypothetical protein